MHTSSAVQRAHAGGSSTRSSDSGTQLSRSIAIPSAEDTMRTRIVRAHPRSRVTCLGTARFVSRGTPPTSGPEVLFQNFTSGLPFFRLSAVNGTSGRHGGGGCRLIPVVSSAALVPRRPEQVRLVRCAARRSSRLQESYRAPAAPCALVAGLVPEVYLGNVVQAPWLRSLPRLRRRALRTSAQPVMRTRPLHARARAQLPRASHTACADRAPIPRYPLFPGQILNAAVPEVHSEKVPRAPR